jgi:hypothetical protein
MLRLKKLEDRGRKMIFIGDESGFKAYHMYDLVTKCVHVTRDVVFECSMSSPGGTGALAITMASRVVEYTTIGQVDQETQGADKEPAEHSTLPATNDDVEVDNDIDDGNLDADHDDDALLHFRSINDILRTTGFAPHALVIEELHVVSSDKPTSFAEAECSPSWRKAMMEKMTSIEENDTWSLIDLPPGRKPIGGEVGVQDEAG